MFLGLYRFPKIVRTCCDRNDQVLIEFWPETSRFKLCNDLSNMLLTCMFIVLEALTHATKAREKIS